MSETTGYGVGNDDSIPSPIVLASTRATEQQKEVDSQQTKEYDAAVEPRRHADAETVNRLLVQPLEAALRAWWAASERESHANAEPEQQC